MFVSLVYTVMSQKKYGGGKGRKTAEKDIIGTLRAGRVPSSVKGKKKGINCRIERKEEWVEGRGRGETS